MDKIPVRKLGSTHHELKPGEGFKIRKVQDMVLADKEKNTISQLHRHDFFFILALKKGNGTHEIDFTSYPVGDDSVFCMRPGQAHKLSLKAGCRGFLMEFDTKFYTPYDKISLLRLRKAGHKNYCKLDTYRFNRLHAILGTIFQEYLNKDDGFQDVIKASLNIFFIEFLRQGSNPKTQQEPPNAYNQERLEEFFALLENHIADKKQVVQYADMMNLSMYQLNSIIKASLGKTTSQIIDEHILLESKRYLLATPNQIKDIAYQLGYDDVSYFIRFFKKHTGKSPEVFRHNFK